MTDPQNKTAQSSSRTDAGPAGSKDEAPPLPPGPLTKYPWLTFLLPFVVFMLVGTLEPTPPGDQPEADRGWLDLGIEYQHYPVIYTIKIGLTLAAMVYVLPGYRTFPFRVSRLAIVAGAIGGVVWVALCRFEWEAALLGSLGLEELLRFVERTGFDPRLHLADRPAWAWSFLAIRLFGLVAVVPVMEEFFLRGFVMRFVVDADWWKVPFGRVNRAAIVAGTAVPMLMHPGELLAALVWFSGVTWLMLRTRNLWDCVAAHAMTNLILGCYVLASNDWRLM